MKVLEKKIPNNILQLINFFQELTANLNERPTLTKALSMKHKEFIRFVSHASLHTSTFDAKVRKYGFCNFLRDKTTCNLFTEGLNDSLFLDLELKCVHRDDITSEKSVYFF